MPKDLAEAARAFDRAQLTNDRAELERLVADDYRLSNSAGAVENKAQFITDGTTKGFHLNPFVIEQPIMNAWSDGAVLGGLTTYAGMQGGKAFRLRLRFADVWAKRNGRWQVVYTGVTKAGMRGGFQPNGRRRLRSAIHRSASSSGMKLASQTQKPMATPS